MSAIHWIGLGLATFGLVILAVLCRVTKPSAKS